MDKKLLNRESDAQRDKVVSLGDNIDKQKIAHSEAVKEDKIILQPYNIKLKQYGEMRLYNRENAVDEIRQEMVKGIEELEEKIESNNRICEQIIEQMNEMEVYQVYTDNEKMYKTIYMTFKNGKGERK